MAAKQPLRVLCLAGFRQSERGFREKTGALRKALRGRAELVCLSGPHPVVDKAGPEGVGPESGETSSARKCAPSLFSRPHNTRQHTPNLASSLIPLTSFAHNLHFFHHSLPGFHLDLSFPSLHAALFPTSFPSDRLLTPQPSLPIIPKHSPPFSITFPLDSAMP